MLLLLGLVSAAADAAAAACAATCCAANDVFDKAIASAAAQAHPHMLPNRAQHQQLQEYTDTLGQSGNSGGGAAFAGVLWTSCHLPDRYRYVSECCLRSLVCASVLVWPFIAVEVLQNASGAASTTINAYE